MTKIRGVDLGCDEDAVPSPLHPSPCENFPFVWESTYLNWNEARSGGDEFMNLRTCLS